MRRRCLSCVQKVAIRLVPSGACGAQVGGELVVVLGIYQLSTNGRVLRVVKRLQVLVKRLLANESPSALAESATQQFNAAVSLSHVCGEVVLGRIMLVASLFPATIAFALVWRQVNEAMAFEMTRAFECLLAALNVATELAFSGIARRGHAIQV